MKKYIVILSLLSLALVSCKHGNIYTPVSFNVTLDGENTYYAGDVVTFKVSGNPDNLVFYSGELGHNYAYKDRYTVDASQVVDATLSLSIQGQYGFADGLDVYVSNSFAGLNGSDADADKATIQAMVDGGMKDWKKLEYVEGSSGTWVSNDYDMSEYLSNFCLAFHYHPVNEKGSALRTYRINGYMNVELADVAVASVLMLSGFDFISFNMLDNSSTSTPYINSNPYETDTHTAWPSYKTNAILRYNVTVSGNVIPLVFQGIAKDVLDYQPDIWLISIPQALNEVENDTGTVVKNLQNKIETYEYTYSEPGTYKATFIGSNANYKGSSREVKEVTVIVAPNE